MSAYSLPEIRTAALNVRARAPTLAMGHQLGPDTRMRLERLAVMCGLTTVSAPKANDADLISIYLVAIKDPRAGERVAERIQTRLDDGLGFPAPLPEPSYKAFIEPYKAFSAPEPPPAAPKVDLVAIREMIKQEVKAGALEPLQTMLTMLDKSVRDDFETMLTGSRVEALDELRNHIVLEAQAAAAIALKDLRPTLLDIVKDPLAPAPVSLGMVHKETPKLIAMLHAGVNAYLHGPSGSGKTTAAHKAAEAFGVKFYFAAKVESEYQLMGFKDARGETVRTQFREAYEHGGVFLFDEMDASSPSAVVALNAALANGVCPFPDAIVKRHADFHCIGAGNTKLTGANRQYAGRNQLDAASIDRFAFLEWNYDDNLELALATDHTWARYVQAVRKAVAERGLNHLVTPRATYDGCRLLAKNMDWDTVAKMVIYKGLEADTVRQIEQALDYSKAA